MMLTFSNVTKEFRLDEENTITPVRNVSLEIEDGEFIVITGRSGTGKTTLLNLAAGMVRPTSGHVMIDNFDLGEMDDRQLSSLRSRKIGFIFQFPSLLPPLTIKDNVSLPSIFTNGNGSSDAGERAAQLLDTLGLASKLDVYPKQLSAGEQKRVVIARSMINQPQLILADEPTSDLDYRTEKEVMGILRDINSRGVTFLIVTHSLELISFATRAFEMENGKLNQITPSAESTQLFKGQPGPVLK
jgi:ABC-type lipoprotein export system ATPase subunit